VLSQQIQVNFPISVEDLVGLGSYAARRSMKAEEHRGIVQYALQKVGMTAFSHRSYPSLSGGEQQRVLLAKCIVQLESNYWRPHTQYLFLDEATASLDIKQKHEVMQLVRNIIQRRGIGVVAIIHDLGLAATYADRVVLLKQGKILAQGNRDTTLTSTNISKTFELETNQIPGLFFDHLIH
jgi:iron complex transport system ATP-binding protein